MKRLKIFLLVTICVLGCISVSFSQKQRRIIQLSGVVFSHDSTVGPMPGVHIYVPKAGRGTTSNRTGFFSMPVITGDSVVISSIGYARQHTIIPDNAPDYMTLMIEMVETATLLETVTITQFPTEEVFKQAVLALNVPMDDRGFDQRNLNAELLALMLKTTPMDGNANYRYYINQYAGSVQDKFQPRMNPFLNPFNWARFFKDLKKNKK